MQLKPENSTSTHGPDELSDREFRFVSELIHGHCGINLHGGKKDLVRARLAKCIRTAGFTDASDYLAHLKQDGSGRELATLTDAISTNLTSFFRERSHFDHLEKEFLPALLARKRKAGRRRLRAWSAGCSTGEEPYSIAMTLLEATGTEPWDVKLLATDISRPVLQRAQRGVFDKARLAAVPRDLQSRFFTALEKDRANYQVARPLREIVRFNHLNLMAGWPFKGPFDFIFCRNVMIYFDKPTQQKLVSRFAEALAPGGLLFTGHSESLTGIAHKLGYVLPTIYCK